MVALWHCGLFSLVVFWLCPHLELSSTPLEKPRKPDLIKVVPALNVIGKSLPLDVLRLEPHLLSWDPGKQHCGYDARLR